MTPRRPRTAASALIGAFLALAAILPAAVPVAAGDPLAARPSERSIDLRQPAALSGGQLTVVRVTGGLSSPLGVTNADDGSGRLFVVERDGKVRIVKSGKVTGTFLDVGSRTNGSGERGLLNVAFHPDFGSNGYVYVYYTRADDGDIMVTRLTANAARTSASLTTEYPILRIDHPLDNHNGGGMAFGPDGYLYLGVGDGGGSNDPDNNGQDKNSLLGKILRIDVNGTGSGTYRNYSIPADNPFVGVAGADSVWAWGLRNPWRISFDRVTGNLFIADVGQNKFEEVNREPNSSTGGLNYGWDVMEGKGCRVAGCTPPQNDVLPVAAYSTYTYGCAITGGYVYRGAHRDMQGLYVFGDYCSGRIWTMPNAGSAITVRRDTSLLISSFGESETGELFLTDLGGSLYRVIAPEFSDIASSTFLDAIHWIFYEGITVGCGNGRFCPTASVTRAQMALFIMRGFDVPPATPGNDYFVDDNGVTGEGAINALAEAGIAGGCDPARKLFCPTARVTREQMALFLDRAIEPPLPPTSTNFFDDDDGKTGEAAINRLAAAGITGGCGPRKYCPTAFVTRGQMAAFLRRALE